MERERGRRGNQFSRPKSRPPFSSMLMAMFLSSCCFEVSCLEEEEGISNWTRLTVKAGQTVYKCSIKIVSHITLWQNAFSKKYLLLVVCN